MFRKFFVVLISTIIAIRQGFKNIGVFVYFVVVYHTGISIFNTEHFYGSDGMDTCEPVRILVFIRVGKSQYMYFTIKY
jgi:hypothetical protein